MLQVQGARKFFVRFIRLIAGFPTVYWFGVEGDYNILIMSILGPNLQ